MEDYRVQIFTNNRLEDDFQASSHAHALAMAYYYCSNCKQDLDIKITSSLGLCSKFHFIAAKYSFV